jgi:peptidoglycan-N-acetylglucosamine deacetylase
VGEQRGAQGSRRRRASGFERLQCVTGLVTEGGRQSEGEAEGDLFVHQWHHPAIGRPLLLGAAAATAAAWWFPALAPVVPGIADLLALPRRIDEPGAVALTFDDGPHPQGTVAVLEALREMEARATFFLCGEQIQREPSLALEIAAAGHTVALHGHRHRNVLRLPPRSFVEDLKQGIAMIEDTVGLRPTLYRPPYGILSYPAIAELRARALRPLLWSRWGHDWRNDRSPQSIAAELTRDLRAGDVLLLHDADHYSAPECWRGTVAALPAVLETIEGAGLRPTSL